MAADTAKTAGRLAARKRVFVFAALPQYFGQRRRRGGIAGLGQRVGRRSPQFRAFVLEKWDQRRGNLWLWITSQRIDDRFARSQLSLFSERGEQRRDRIIAQGAEISSADFQSSGRKSANDRRGIPLKSLAERFNDRCFNRTMLVTQERADSNHGIDPLLLVARGQSRQQFLP